MYQTLFLFSLAHILFRGCAVDNNKEIRFFPKHLTNYLFLVNMKINSSYFKAGLFQCFKLNWIE